VGCVSILKVVIDAVILGGILGGKCPPHPLVSYAAVFLVDHANCRSAAECPVNNPMRCRGFKYLAAQMTTHGYLKSQAVTRRTSRNFSIVETRRPRRPRVSRAPFSRWAIPAGPSGFRSCSSSLVGLRRDVEPGCIIHIRYIILGVVEGSH